MLVADHAAPVLAPINTIERLGGANARCMVAEIFLLEITFDTARRAIRNMCTLSNFCVVMQYRPAETSQDSTSLDGLASCQKVT